MVDYSAPPEARPPPPRRAPPEAEPEPEQRPSKIDALKHALNPAVSTAIVLALGAATTAITSWSSNQAKDRVAYETLRVASERNAAANESCRQGLLEVRTWVEQLAVIGEQRSVATEKAVARKVTRAAAPPLPPATPVAPLPKAPPAPAPLEPAALPSFDGLAQ
jgi:hypothetical protein